MTRRNTANGNHPKILPNYFTYDKEVNLMRIRK